MPDVITETNNKLLGSISGTNIMTAIGWIIFIIVVVAACIFGYVYWRDRKVFSKIITAFEIVGVYFEPSIRDTAKVVKIGTGGFEILFLKKQKTWKLSYGGRVGRKTYYYFIMPDGYWYNGLLSASLQTIDKLGGFIPVIATNPSMRAQYTSLEKQIDSLHQTKTNFWEKYGSWILAIGFVLVAGVMLWLNYQEYVKATANQGVVMDKIGLLIDKLNILMGNAQTTAANGGLQPIK